MAHRPATATDTDTDTDTDTIRPWRARMVRRWAVMAGIASTPLPTLSSDVDEFVELVAR